MQDKQFYRELQVVDAAALAQVLQKYEWVAKTVATFAKAPLPVAAVILPAGVSSTSLQHALLKLCVRAEVYEGCSASELRRVAQRLSNQNTPSALITLRYGERWAAALRASRA